jgi:hypothetical protein
MHPLNPKVGQQIKIFQELDHNALLQNQVPQAQVLFALPYR